MCWARRSPIKLMKLKALAFVSLLAIAPLANALVITVDSVQYDISAVQTTFSDSSVLLMDQPWWGDEAAAYLFAATVGDFFVESIGRWGPLFAYSNNPGAFYGVSSLLYGDSLAPVTTDVAGNLFYAVATRVTDAVPDLTSTLHLGLMALFGLAFAARRFKRAEA